MNILFLNNNYNLYNIEQRFLQKLGYFNLNNYIKKLSYLGFEYSFLYPLTLTIQSAKGYFLTLPLLRINEYKKYSYNWNNRFIADFYNIVNFSNNYNIYNKLSQSCSSLYPFFTSLHVLIHTGAKANMTQLYQLIGIRGFLSNVGSDNFNLPILSNFNKGLNIFEYFISCIGSRKGVIDTAIKTADSGYLTKRIVESIQELVIKEYYCGTKNFSIYNQNINVLGFQFLANNLFLYGKILRTNITDLKTKKIIIQKNKYLDLSTIKRLDQIKSKFIKFSLTSPKLCLIERTVCSTCLGTTTIFNNFISKQIGVFTGQTIGEPSTQLTLRTFHTGGVCSMTNKEEQTKEKLTSFFQNSKKYKICSFKKFFVHSKFQYKSKFRLSNFGISFNRKQVIKWINFRSIFFANIISLFANTYNKLSYIYQRNVPKKQNYKIVQYSSSNKSINILIKNKHSKWLYLNINIPLVWDSYLNYQFKLGKYLLATTFSINKKYSSLKTIIYKRFLYTTTINSNFNSYSWISLLNIINEHIKINKLKKIKLCSMSFFILNFKKIYNLI